MWCEVIKLPWHRRKRVSRGQALVEFALILPILVLLVMLALDFGRVFFGWVGLNNAARIAANAAAANPTAWDGGAADLMLQAQYRQQTTNDLQPINCDAPAHTGRWLTSDIPDPTFTNVDPSGTSSPYENGDHVSVTLSCRFYFLTPLVGNLLGNPLVIRATAEFPVRGAEIDGIPVTGGGCGGASVPNLVGSTVAQARVLWSGAGFNAGTFTPASGSDTDTVTAQTTSPVTTVGQCVDPNTAVTVTHIVGGTTCTMPQLVGRSVSDAQTLYNGALFTGTFNVNQPPNGNYNVKAQSLVAGQVYPCSSAITVSGN